MASKEAETGKPKESDQRTDFVEFAGTKTALVDISETLHEQDEKPYSKKKIIRDARDLVTQILVVEDDPSLNPWTFRMWFLGIGMSIFAGTVTTINTFKPQAINVHLIFVAVVTYVLGKAMAAILPSKGRIGKILNPGPFNKKEHAAICIMCGASASTPEGMMILAVQKLYYNINPSKFVGIFLILSTQMLGYGVAGVLRHTLVYPCKMIFPINLPIASIMETLHRDSNFIVKKKMRVFYIAFILLLLWQSFPQYIMPILGGVSIFCLAMQHNLFVTYLFGGTMANEGLGILAFSFDWITVSANGNPLWVPFQTMFNSFVGYLISIVLYMSIYYSNTWDARRFPFLSPLLFSSNSTATKYAKYNQTLILSNNVVDEKLVQKYGLPHITATHAMGMIVVNISIMASITHVCIWHWDDIKSALLVFAPFSKIFKPQSWDLKFWKYKTQKISEEEADKIDPHYRLMLAYEDSPTWWFGILWVVACVFGLMTSMMAGSTLDWWAFIVAVILSAVLLPFFAALHAMFGFVISVQPLIQLIGGYLLPGRPIANLYFTTFGWQSLYQAKFMLRELKLGQYLHLAPRCTFVMQITGTTIGCLMSYIMMQQITTEKRDILLAIQGSNVWSGQHLQKENSAAITWGGLAKHIYGVGGRYQWVSLGFLIGIFAPIPFWILHKLMPKLRWDYWNSAIIMGHAGLLSNGTHSSFLFHYLTGFISQFYLRKYRTNWFIKYNYILSAGMDGGAQIIVFILTFAVFGAGGTAIQFPPYWGNNYQKGNYDYCMRDPGLGGKPKSH